MGKNKGIALIIGLIIVLGVAVGYLWTEIQTAKKQVLLPIFSKQFSVVAGEINWNLKNFQPIITGFITQNEQNLVLVKFSDQDGQEKTAKLFVSGKTPGGYQVEEIGLQLADGAIEKLTFEQLKKKLKKGLQIRAQYINAAPEFLDVRNCKAMAENFRQLCFLTDVLAGHELNGTTEAELKTGSNQAPVIPITSLSWKLYED